MSRLHPRLSLLSLGLTLFITNAYLRDRTGVDVIDWLSNL